MKYLLALAAILSTAALVALATAAGFPPRVHYVDHDKVAAGIERRFAGGNSERVSSFATELAAGGSGSIGCALTPTCAATGFRSWLAGRRFRWLTPRRLRALTVVAMCIAGLVATSMTVFKSQER